MWTLFTRALTLGTSSVRVSVINTSVNFVCTAVLGWWVFGEELGGELFLPVSNSFLSCGCVEEAADELFFG